MATVANYLVTIKITRLVPEDGFRLEVPLQDVFLVNVHNGVQQLHPYPPHVKPGESGELGVLLVIVLMLLFYFGAATAALGGAPPPSNPH